MKIQSAEFIRLALPFNNGFEHARAARKISDTILVKLTAETGEQGWGEILPRPYVTGETVDAILDETTNEPAALVQSLSGVKIVNQSELEQWIDKHLSSYQQHTALFGGLEIAMWDLLSQSYGVDWDQALGPINERPLGRCVTIGFDASTEKLRARAIDAKLKNATVVKLKIGLDDDIERIKLLDKHLNGKVPIRVDANGLFDTDCMRVLLEACAGTTALQSIEQPFSHADNSHADALQSLFSQFHIPFVADESVCSIENARQWQKSGGFQIYNLRIGKHGGIRATRIIRDLANASGIGLVSGSMVGETGILTQASELLLSRSTGFDYVEGLGQNRQFLAIDPVELVAGGQRLKTFKLKPQADAELVQGRRTIMCS
ncbi:MAG: enolase C-terminal domain-like protein [Granulosicoccaceae bacterium]